ncbi:MAG: ACT domain-containing protein, partial [Gracilimonas sp.]|nr:ACT domain-containing protein [Gracilimonas sp.]
VVTHKAKSRIRQFIKQKQRKIAEEGRDIWEKRASRGKLEISEQELNKFANRFKYESTQDLFFDIGSGAFDVNKLFKEVKKYKSTGRFQEEEQESVAPISDEEIQKNYYDAARAVGDGKSLIINGELSNIKYSYANCCNPIPGDDVIGFVSRTGDIKIHRSMCNNAQHLLTTEADRIVDVNWAKNLDTKFLGAIKVIGGDRVGMINDITDVLSKSLETNMKSINVSSDSGMFEGIITLYVDGISHLNKIMKRLEKIEGVKNVLRYE